MLTLRHRFKSDEALMLAYQRGDTSAFECLYRRHKDGLFAFLFRSCPRQAVVEELAQDAWVAVINAAGRYHSEARFKTWLYQIAHNRLVDYWRRRDNQHPGLDHNPEVSAAENPATTGDKIEQIMSAIGQLPGAQRDALLLQEQGFTHREIAEITRSGEETVKSRLRYARKQLRQRLGEQL